MLRKQFSTLKKLKLTLNNMEAKYIYILGAAILKAGAIANPQVVTRSSKAYINEMEDIFEAYFQIYDN